LGNVPLSKLSCDDLINILSKINELKGIIEKLTSEFNENAITGRVLMHCDLNELKSVLKLNFGHWEVLKLLILNLRTSAIFKSTIPQLNNEQKEYIDTTPQTVVTQAPRKQKSVIEKQVN
jgi:ankyrin repeat-rich membrane spanning protein